MYKPLFNQVLVEIDDSDAKWGKGNDDSFGGETFREGQLREFGTLLYTKDYPEVEGVVELLEELIGKRVLWNEGHEAGKVFEHDDKKYALVYWWELVAVDGE